MKDFPTGKPCPTPSPALAMDRRNFHPLEWSSKWHDAVIRQFRELKAVWKHVPGEEYDWDCAEPFTTKPSGFGKRKRPGYTAFKGRCNDFAPALRRALIVANIPADCLRLVTCEIVTKATGKRQGHMVLAVLTTEGTLICCNVRDCWPLISEAWDNKALRYDWRSMEGPGNSGWVKIGGTSLEDALEMIG